MAPTPADLHAAADDLRSSASYLTLAFEPVGPRSDGETWEGPAAESFRRTLVAVEGRVEAVTTALRARATDLDHRAEHLRRVQDAAEVRREPRVPEPPRWESVFATVEEER